MELANLIISALTFVATIAGIVVAIVIYGKQRKFDVETEQERKRVERQALQDELDSFGITNSGFSLEGYSRGDLARYKYLKKRLQKR